MRATVTIEVDTLQFGSEPGLDYMYPEPATVLLDQQDSHRTPCGTGTVYEQAENGWRDENGVWNEECAYVEVIVWDDGRIEADGQEAYCDELPVWAEPRRGL